MTTVRETSLPNLLHRGKVRDTYRLGDGLLLMVATDRISAFDAVLPMSIPEKGVVLCHLSAFWFQKTAHIVPNHLVALAQNRKAMNSIQGSDLLDSLPYEVARRAMIVRQAQRIDVECVARGYIAGSAWVEYSREGTVSGVAMPKGLIEGEKLPDPIFTPTTKAEEGHDQNLTMSEMEALVGGPSLTQELKEKTLEVYQYAHDYALERGIVLADTKMEFGILDGRAILIDELLTPDSSRFWDASQYRPGRSQPNFDKQFVRDWLIDIGWNREPPAPELPSEIVEKTRDRYREAFRRLTGRPLDEENSAGS